MKNTYVDKVGCLLRNWIVSIEQTQVYHKCIAALICDHDNNAFVATMGTGTHWNSSKPCYQDPPFFCSMHAESLCYDAAPTFFQIEIINCLDCKKSIFIHNTNERFKLKNGVTFHLIITEPPCGWCQDGEKPCFEWKRSTAGPPHVLTCSSKILINSQMGIQGYVSHLLEKEVYVSTVTILYDKSTKISRKPTTEFEIDSKLPKFYVKEYDPKIFQYGKAITFRPMNLMSSKNNSPPDGSGSGKKGLPKNIEAGDRSVILVGDELVQVYCGGDESIKTYGDVKDFCFKQNAYKVDELLEKSVDEYLQAERRNAVESNYEALKDKNRREALNVLKENLKVKIDDQTKALQNMTYVMDSHDPCAENVPSISQCLKNAFQGPPTKHTFPFSNGLVDFIEELKKKLNNVRKEGLTWLEDHEIMKTIEETPECDIQLDCSWDKYFKQIPPPHDATQ